MKNSLLIVFILFTGIGQAQAVEPQFEIWNVFDLHFRHRESMGAYLQIEPKRKWTEGSELEHLVVRAAGVYRPGDGWSLLFGPAFTPSFQPYRYEFRLWEQARREWSLLDETLGIQGRLRFEQRWIQNESQVANRVQLYGKYREAFAKKAAEVGWGIAGFASVSFNLNALPDRSVSGGFYESEIFLGPSWRVTPEIIVESGYLNNIVRSPSGDRTYNIWYTSFSFTF